MPVFEPSIFLVIEEWVAQSRCFGSSCSQLKQVRCMSKAGVLPLLPSDSEKTHQTQWAGSLVISNLKTRMEPEVMAVQGSERTGSSHLANLSSIVLAYLRPTV